MFHSLNNERLGIEQEGLVQLSRDGMMLGPRHQYKSFITWKLCFLHFIYLPLSCKAITKCHSLTTPLKILTWNEQNPELCKSIIWQTFNIFHLPMRTGLLTLNTYIFTNTRIWFLKTCNIFILTMPRKTFHFQHTALEVMNYLSTLWWKTLNRSNSMNTHKRAKLLWKKF